MSLDEVKEEVLGLPVEEHTKLTTFFSVRFRRDDPKFRPKLVRLIDVECQSRKERREALKDWRDENDRFARSKLRAVLLAVPLLVAAIWCSTAAATYWYVSNSGSDNNPGTNTTAPLQHIQTAANRAAYGDTANI